MSNIKSQYAEIVALLEANKNKKVSTILPQILELVTTKQNSKNFIKDSEGNVTSVYCYYHKQWEEVATHEYGKKASSATGLASMCKIGVSHWTKQQRAKKAAESALLASLADGTLDIKELPKAQEDIVEAANAIVPIA
mgnify:CR=1 FL=1